MGSDGASGVGWLIRFAWTLVPAARLHGHPSSAAWAGRVHQPSPSGALQPGPLPFLALPLPSLGAPSVNGTEWRVRKA